MLLVMGYHLEPGGVTASDLPQAHEADAEPVDL
jgi:hypothetical protein